MCLYDGISYLLIPGPNVVKFPPCANSGLDTGAPLSYICPPASPTSRRQWSTEKYLCDRLQNLPWNLLPLVCEVLAITRCIDGYGIQLEAYSRLNCGQSIYLDAFPETNTPITRFYGVSTWGNCAIFHLSKRLLEYSCFAFCPWFLTGRISGSVQNGTLEPCLMVRLSCPFEALRSFAITFGINL